jgi:hypothetical protein
MQQFFFFLATPFCFLYTWIKPLTPPSFSLLRRFAMKQGRDASPLILPIFHHSRLQDLILSVPPHTTFYHNTWHLEFVVVCTVLIDKIKKFD